MALRVGFAEADITPPVGTHKIGWLKDIVSDAVVDPLFARVMAIESGEDRVGFMQLDTLCVPREQAARIREGISQQHTFPGRNVMVAATHNHAGPAVANVGDVKRDDAYVETLVAKAVSAFGEALSRMREAEIGFGGAFEFDVPHNRRVVMRDGTVRTHGTFGDRQALHLEGPIDPEVAVLAARSRKGDMLGVLVNFACHPTHHGGDTCLSGGFPCALDRQMKQRGCPVTLFLNGASGNITDLDPRRGGARKSHEEIGAILADDVVKALDGIEYRGEAALGCVSATLQLPFRQVTDDEVKGRKRGAQRFIDPAIYDRDIPRLIERIRSMGTEPAEVQVISIDEYAFAGIPAEYFVQLGLRIKEECHPRHALVVAHANGMVGYVPHRDAFVRGGYETTFGGGSRLAPQAGDMLADCAIRLIGRGPAPLAATGDRRG